MLKNLCPCLLLYYALENCNDPLCFYLFSFIDLVHALSNIKSYKTGFQYMTNKRFLILAPYFFPYQNPRSRRVYRLLELMDKKGFVVDVVCSKRSEQPPQFSENIKIYPCGNNSIKEKFSSLSGIVPAAKSGTKQRVSFKEFAKKINALVLKSIYWPDDSFIWIKHAKKQAEQLCQNNTYDALISFSLPYASSVVAEYLIEKHPNIKWINDIGDPLAFQENKLINNSFLYEKRNQRTERRILNKADLNILTNKGLKRIYEEALSVASNKFAIVGPFNQVGQPVLKKSATTPLRFLYMGSFYPILRSPKRLRDLFLNILDQNKDIAVEFHLLGLSNKKDINVFLEHPKLKDKIHIQSFLEQKETTETIQNSHFLINISNRSVHQLPSKCADYIASCLPIINIYEFEKDVSARYLAPYPLVFNYNSLKTDVKQTRALGNFIELNKDQTVDPDISEKILEQSNPAYMLKLILMLLKQ